jgi:hypothetical protein
MPSTSPKQKRFMAAAAHNPQFASKAGISQSVAQEFNSADQRKATASALRKAPSTSTGGTANGSGAG